VLSMSTEGGGPVPPGLQFDKAEFEGVPVTRTCQRCQRTISHEYFDAGGQAVCHDCSQDLSGARGGGPAFLRALAWGAGAAVLGTIVWFAILKISGYELGLIAIAVGLAVGYAVRKGSGGRGGWKYQALAMGLTYVSITASYVPIVIKEFDAAAEKQLQKELAAQTTPALDPDQPHLVPALRPPQVEPKLDLSAGRTGFGLFLFLGFSFAVALAAPFLGGAENIMGLIIIAIALYEAWKLNKKVPITGPFRLAPAEPPAQPVAGVG
jgi:hypothetical protein